LAPDENRRMREESYAQWMRRAASAVRALGFPILSLFDSAVPEPVELVRQTIAEGFGASVTSRYVSAFTNGNPFVIDWIAARYGVPAAQVLCTTGATGALSLLYRALAQPGDHVLVETPGFDVFAEIGCSQGLTVSDFPRSGERFALDPDAITARLRPESRLIVLSNLHNPSGMAADTAAMEALARIAEARRIWVIVDEVYGDYASLDARPMAAAQISPRFISVSSLTKIYGLHTVRCGWIVGAPEAMAIVKPVGERLEFGVSNLAHAVAALVLENAATFDAYSHAVLAAARPVITHAHEQWRREGLVEGVLPEFGCITFPRLVGIDDTLAFSDWLAARSGVIVAPGEHFEAPGHVRIGFGQPVEKLETAIGQLTEGLRAYPRPQQARAARR